MKSKSRKLAWGAASLALLLAAALVWRDAAIAWFTGTRPAAHAAAGVRYTCSMDPSVMAAGPGQCPICGMALTPVTAEQRASDIIRLDPATQQRIGVRFAPAGARRLVKQVVGFGQVAAAQGTPRVVATVYGEDGAALKVGQPVRVSSPAVPLTPLAGSIAGRDVDEAMNPRLDVTVEDPGGLLAPGMLAEVQIELDLAERLAVPAEAVIYAGKRRIAFVDRGGGQLEPRELRVGVQAGGFIEVASGLTAGERVVVSGTFLVAAESRIRSASTLWADAPPAPETREEKRTEKLVEEVAEQLKGGAP